MASQSRSRDPRMTKRASQKDCRCAKTLPLAKDSQNSSLPSSTPASAGRCGDASSGGWMQPGCRAAIHTARR